MIKHRKFIKKLEYKSIRDYLKIYMKLDITLQADTFNAFRNTIWDKF